VSVRNCKELEGNKGKNRTQVGQSDYTERLPQGDDEREVSKDSKGIRTGGKGSHHGKKRDIIQDQGVAKNHELRCAVRKKRESEEMPQSYLHGEEKIVQGRKTKSRLGKGFNTGVFKLN